MTTTPATQTPAHRTPARRADPLVTPATARPSAIPARLLGTEHASTSITPQPQPTARTPFRMLPSTPQPTAPTSRFATPSVLSASSSATTSATTSTTITPGSGPSIQSLKETELVTALLYPLAQYNDQWAVQDKKLAEMLMDSLLRLTVQTKDMLLSPTTLLETVQPISEEERSSSKENAGMWVARLAVMVFLPIPALEFARNLGYLRAFTHSPFTSSYTTDGILQAFPPPLFEPWLDNREAGQLPPIRVLMECFNNTLFTLKQLAVKIPNNTPIKGAGNQHQIPEK